MPRTELNADRAWLQSTSIRSTSLPSRCLVRSTIHRYAFVVTRDLFRDSADRVPRVTLQISLPFRISFLSPCPFPVCHTSMLCSRLVSVCSDRSQSLVVIAHTTPVCSNYVLVVAFPTPLSTVHVSAPSLLAVNAVCIVSHISTTASEGKKRGWISLLHDREAVSLARAYARSPDHGAQLV